MRTEADIRRERESYRPVRELISVTSVHPLTLVGGERIWIVKGHLSGNVIQQRSIRTVDDFKASLCQRHINGKPLDMVWKRNPFNRMAWDEHDLLTVDIL